MGAVLRASAPFGDPERGQQRRCWHPDQAVTCKRLPRCPAPTNGVVRWWLVWLPHRPIPWLRARWRRWSGRQRRAPRVVRGRVTVHAVATIAMSRQALPAWPTQPPRRWARMSGSAAPSARPRTSVEQGCECAVFLWLFLILLGSRCRAGALPYLGSRRRWPSRESLRSSGRTGERAGDAAISGITPCPHRAPTRSSAQRSRTESYVL